MPAPACTNGKKAHYYINLVVDHLPDEGHKKNRTRRTTLCAKCGCTKSVTAWLDSRRMRIKYSTPSYNLGKEAD